METYFGNLPDTDIAMRVCVKPGLWRKVFVNCEGRGGELKKTNYLDEGIYREISQEYRRTTQGPIETTGQTPEL